MAGCKANDLANALELEQIKHTLDAGRRALDQFRSLVFRTTVTGSLVWFLSGAALDVVARLEAASYVGRKVCVLEFLAEASKSGFALCLGLAALPDDRDRTLVVLAALTGLLSLGILTDVWQLEHALRFTGLNRALWNIPIKLALLCSFLFAMTRSSAERMQRVMWSGMSLFQSVRMLIHAVMGAASCATGGGPAPWFRIPVSAAFVYIASTQSARHRVHGFLRRQLADRQKENAASGVAALLGRRSMTETLEQGRARFRCIDLAQLEEADLASNRPDPALFLKTSPAVLGSCDAFISHSWHDDPGQKWNALQAWRTQFVAQEGREPRVWIDKCCLDQANIDVDLPCLPIFMSGCKRLVLLVGSTYLSRLWCVIELFTFVQMGLDSGSLEFRSLCPHGSIDEEGKSTFMCTLQNFDVSMCECVDGSDKEKMQSVIYAAFGDVENFNREISQMLQAASLQGTV